MLPPRAPAAPHRIPGRRRWRIALPLGAVALALLAAAAPWTVAADRIAAGLTRQLADGTGLRLSVSGRATIALLPVPRIKLARAGVTNAAGVPLIEDAQLRGQLALGPLLRGRIALTEVAIVGGTVTLARPVGASPWAQALTDAAMSSEDGTWLRRLAIRDATLRVLDARSGPTAILRNASAVLSWPAPSGPLDLSAAADWAGEPVRLAFATQRPDALAGGRPEAIEASVATRHGKAQATGTLALRDGLRFTGDAAADTPSLRALLAWLGRDAPASFDRPVTIAGSVRADGAGLDASTLAIGLGRDTLDGALSAGFGDRPTLRATLAAGSLDLDWLRRALRPHLVGWSESGAPLGLPALDLDLRLSASELRLGTAVLADLAASLIVDGERLEATLLRATLEGGSVKGRLAAILPPDRRNLRLAASVDGVDAAPLLAALGLPAGATGRTTGTATLDAAAAPGASLLGTLSGRASLALKRGSVAGLDVAGAVRRPEAARGGGRTEFDAAQIGVRVADGIVEIVDASADAATLRASLEGRVSLPARALDLRALAVPVSGPGVVVDVTGPWSGPRVAARPASDAARTPATR